MPSLSPWRIGCPPQNPVISRRRRSRSHSPTRLVQIGSRRRSRSRSRSRSPYYFRRGSPSPARVITIQAEEYSAPVQTRHRSPSPIRWRNVENVSSNTLSATFRIPGRSSIPSDDDSHKVVIQVLNLQANLEWVCIPRRLETVFLKVRVMISRSEWFTHPQLKVQCHEHKRVHSLARSCECLPQQHFCF